MAVCMRPMEVSVRVVYQIRPAMRAVTSTLLVRESAYCVVANRERCETKMVLPAPTWGRSDVAVYGERRKTVRQGTVGRKD